MPNIEIATTTGRMLVLNAKAIEQFHTGLRGGHLLRGDGGYDAARKIYNADRSSARDYRPLRWSN